MNRFTSALLLAVATTLALGGTAGCTRLDAVPDGVTVTCGSASDCVSGMLCTRGRCADPSSIDTTPPDLATTVVVSPSRLGAGQAITVALHVTEPLDGPPAVSLALDPLPALLDCEPVATLTYTCSHVVTGDENGGLGGAVAVSVRMRDLAGNDTTRNDVATVTLDFFPPSPTIASVAYLPAASNPLPVVSRATRGTVVRVAVSADELLSRSAAPSLVGHLGDATLPFSVATEAPGGSDVEFVATIAGVEPDGAYTLAVTWTDQVGNEGTALVPALTVNVKTSAPALIVDQDALVFVRSPWGNAAREDLGGYQLPAGPYFALEPSDALTSASTLPAGALLLAGGAVPSSVIVQSAADPESAQVLGVLRPDAGGRFPRQKLVSPDLPGIWLAGVDDAGNRAPAVQVRDTEWVATPNPSGGLNPSALLATGNLLPTRAQTLALRAATATDVAGIDAQALVAQAGGEWVERTGNGLRPDGRYEHALAYDGARGRVVLFGGNSQPFGDTWEWDGTSWFPVATTGPSARGLHAMAYDSARGRVVLFGGTDGRYAQQGTWEWDGSAWTLVAASGPPARLGHAMAYDSVRGRVVLFGGARDQSSSVLQDTWEWDGTSWTLVATDGPPARQRHAMAFDTVRGRTVLFGGTNGADVFQDTWEWDGASWTRVATGGPSARQGHGVAFDGARGRLVLFGGDGDPSDSTVTWEWDGATWTSVASGGPARDGHAMAYDVARSKVVLFGGYGVPRMQDTWEWDGARWSPRAAGNPDARCDQAMAFDDVRGRVVMQGGTQPFTGIAFPETWEWDGGAWTSIAPLVGPGGRIYTAMVFDGARARTVLHGGQDAAGQAQHDTWGWDGTGWTTVASTGPVSYGHAMAYDVTRDRVVLSGGTAGSATWEWDGTSWTSIARPGPGSRFLPAMAFDLTRNRTVLFGGSDHTDTWEWDGATWTQVASTGPNVGRAHAMAYDRARGRIVLFGGFDGYDMAQRGTWEWDGASWTSVATTGPSARGYHAMAYDGTRGRVVLFGGRSQGYVATQDTWEWIEGVGQSPAIQFEPSMASLGVSAAALTGIRVRALAGGTFGAAGPDEVGAELVAWANRGSANEPGVWIALPGASNHVPVPDPGSRLSGTAGALISWRSTSADELRRVLVERAGLAFQVRPRGGAGSNTALTRVAVDYLEVRVRYTAP